MNQPITPQPNQSAWIRLRNECDTLFFRAADRLVPARWFSSQPLDALQPRAKRGRLSVEIVSHCWQYAHLLVYNLSAYVHYPPQNLDVTATVYHCTEDLATVRMLDFFSKIKVPHVRWNWQAIPREILYRRSIGRNRAAVSTQADWIWYIDCDLIFHRGCLDGLGRALQGRTDRLLFPRGEFITSLLEDENPILNNGGQPELVDIDPSIFHASPIHRAIGAYQITHGDVARTCGYCKDIRVFQSPSQHWRKTYEDRSYRWLLETQGEPIDVPAIYRIRHINKGRYKQGSYWSGVRGKIRAMKCNRKAQKMPS